MDAELLQAFNALEKKIDANNEQVNRRFDAMDRALEKIEKTHDADHDKLIELKANIENNVKDFNDHIIDEREYGRRTDAKFQDVYGKLWKFGTAIAILSAGIGGGSYKIIDWIFGG